MLITLLSNQFSLLNPTIKNKHRRFARWSVAETLLLQLACTLCISIFKTIDFKNAKPATDLLVKILHATWGVPGLLSWWIAEIPACLVQWRYLPASLVHVIWRICSGVLTTECLQVSWMLQESDTPGAGSWLFVSGSAHKRSVLET